MRLLFFQLQQQSYESYTYFSESLAAEFRKNGHETCFFRAAEEPLQNMERFSGESFDAVIDFNSNLPKLRMEDHCYFLDTIQAPFFNVILDHPLYHHDSLKQDLTNYHVVCLDWNHKAYLEAYYPHIRSVNVIPMTGSAASPTVPFSDRRIPLLFTGSYTSPEEVLDALSHIPPFMQENVHALIELCTRNPKLPIEAAAQQLFQGTVVTELFPLHMQSFFLADTYLRAKTRHDLLQILLEAELPIRICGNGYEKAPFFNQSSGIFMQERPFSETFALMSQAKITLNLMPGFKAGAHDRIFSAMLNGSIALTDGSTWISRHLSPTKNVLLYSLSDLPTLPVQIREALADEEMLRSVAEEGQKEAVRCHTWANRCLQLEQIISQFSWDSVPQ